MLQKLEFSHSSLRDMTPIIVFNIPFVLIYPIIMDQWPLQNMRKA